MSYFTIQDINAVTEVIGAWLLCNSNAERSEQGLYQN